MPVITVGQLQSRDARVAGCGWCERREKAFAGSKLKAQHMDEMRHHHPLPFCWPMCTFVFVLLPLITKLVVIRDAHEYAYNELHQQKIIVRQEKEMSTRPMHIIAAYELTATSDQGTKSTPAVITFSPPLPLLTFHMIRRELQGVESTFLGYTSACAPELQ